MPWSVIIRAVVRLAAGLFLWRAATARRGAYRTAGGPPLQATPAQPKPGRLDSRDAIRRLREGASLGWRLLSAAVLIVATALLVTGGITLTVLTPRWLGIALLVLSVVAFVAAVLDVLTVRHLLIARRRRVHDAELRRQISEPVRPASAPPP